MYGLGPLVVCCGVAAAGYMITQGIAHVLPHKAPAWRPAHLLCMALLAANFFFNYTHAILTDPGTADQSSYDRLLRHARDAGLVSSQDYERQQLGALSLATLEDPQFALPAEDPFAWSFCRRSGMLKPPRAHFDGVTNQLVLNMDHYCVRALTCSLGSACRACLFFRLTGCAPACRPSCSIGLGVQRRRLRKLSLLSADCPAALVCFGLWLCRDARPVHGSARAMVSH